MVLGLPGRPASSILPGFAAAGLVTADWRGVAMDQRAIGWSASEGPEVVPQEGARSGTNGVAAIAGTSRQPGTEREEEAPAGERALEAPRLRPEAGRAADGPQAPPPVNRGDMIGALNEVLDLDPRRTAVVTIDCQRAHLDLAVATMPVAPQEAASLVASTGRLLRHARAWGMSVVHVVSANRILPVGQPEVLCNPFWAAVESTRHSLTPDRDSLMSRHNLVGTVQTQLMPELGPEPGDVVIDRKRRLGIFHGTDLELTLHELGIDTVVLAGVDTNASVLCAAFEALNRDLQTVVISDCVRSTYGDDLHFFALQNVARCLGWVLTVDGLAAKVERAAVAK
jgi:biuret amidohydrolase